MKKLPFLMSSAVLVLAFVLSSTVSFGKPEYSKTEKKACATCHVSAKSKELNAVGKCYSEKKDLKECSK